MTLPYRHRIRHSSLVVRSRARYLTVTEAPHNIESLRVSGKDNLVFRNLKVRVGCESAISDFPSRQLWPLHQGPRLPCICSPVHHPRDTTNMRGRIKVGSMLVTLAQQQSHIVSTPCAWCENTIEDKNDVVRSKIPYEFFTILRHACSQLEFFLSRKTRPQC